MTRISKQSERRATCPKKLKHSFAKKTGPKKDASCPKGFKEHVNAVQGKNIFIPKVK